MVDATFRLDDSFVTRYKDVRPPFGFNGFGELVYMRTYSRIKSDGTNERWFETVRRVVEGTYRMQERHIKAQDLGWSDARAQKSAQEMYDRIFNMKFLPPGRGLWAMGSLITEERGTFAALNNCAFISTDKLDKQLEKPFTFLMDASMLGVGVGFDTKGAGKITLQVPDNPETYVIPDSREGWVTALSKTLRAYFAGEAQPVFDYSLIRAAGEPIRGFGGVASGPGPLKTMLERIEMVLSKGVDGPITITQIVDIMNLIGACVVAGNVRRTAEIAFGDPYSDEYLGLKDYTWTGTEYVGPQAERAEYGWTSNNSIFAEVGMNYAKTAARTARNGEPGYAWLDNIQRYSRMNGIIDWIDKRAAGANPCVEQSLESGEMCCLVETFPANHTDLEDYKRTLKFAYLYAKTVTLGKTQWPETNKVMLRNRRIGCSMSGVQQFVIKNGIDALRQWCEEGYKTIEYYDERYSEWLSIRKSIKKTSIKPSGTVSLLAGATPGIHWPEDLFYIRRMRLAISSALIQPLLDAGYYVEACVGQEDSTVVVEVPVRIDQSLRTTDQVSMWEQLGMAAFLQRYWADNQVSCTVTFQPGLTEKESAEAETLRAKLAAGVYFSAEDELMIEKIEEYEYEHGDHNYYNHMANAEAIAELEAKRDASFSRSDALRLAELDVKATRSEAGQIEHALAYYQYQLKGISFLPKLAKGAYPQMPYEGITEERYNEMCSKLRPMDFSMVEREMAETEKGCDGASCALNFGPPAEKVPAAV